MNDERKTIMSKFKKHDAMYKQILLRIPEELQRTLKLQAVIDNTSCAKIVSDVLREYFQNKKNKEVA